MQNTADFPYILSEKALASVPVRAAQTLSGTLSGECYEVVRDRLIISGLRVVYW